MTKVFFVRHAEPEHSWKEDRTRPLTQEGKNDSKKLLEIFMDKKIDAFYPIRQNTRYFSPEMNANKQMT